MVAKRLFHERYPEPVSTSPLISVDEYLRTSFHPDCDFIDGEVLERNVGKRRHAYAQTQIAVWFDLPHLHALIALRMRVGPNRIRIPDVVVSEMPLPDEEVFTSPPYLCIEVLSPDDTIVAMQDRLDDYLNFGVPNVWVIDPYKHRGWHVTANGWATATAGTMHTADGRVAMPLVDVLLP
jgi:Uma2 family endonuclease